MYERSGEDRTPDLLKTAEEAIADLVAQLERSGELQHLYGQSLDLSDTSPTWFMHRTLKREGFSHPVIELGKELDAAIASRRRVVDQLADQRRRLVSRPGGYTGPQAEGFNIVREFTLRQYRGILEDLNRAIRDHNIAVPTLLQRRPFVVEEDVERLARQVPPVDPPIHPEPAPRSWWQRILYGRSM
ncbi:MAG TPA: hypothetical protein VF898_08315 [Chloroflexota bacterium]